MTEHKAEAVRAAQHLHRNLGHPMILALVEMLESRGASEAVLNVARSYQYHACLKYRKAQSGCPSIHQVDQEWQQQAPHPLRRRRGNAFHDGEPCEWRAF